MKSKNYCTIASKVENCNFKTGISFLTNAPLKCDEPVNQFYCGTCSQCVKNCPAQALKDSLWTVGMPREK